ncbi:1-acyl-sn-glycerol-3-phosphate acyltransferase, partial [Nostoc sp. NIES-2111]
REVRRVGAPGAVVGPRVLQILLDICHRELGAGPLPLAPRLRLAASLPVGMRRALFPDLHRALGGHLRFFLCGGATLPRETMEGWEAFGIRIVEGYGSTECSPVITSNTYAERLPGSAGRAVAGMEVRLSPEGELLARGPSVARGYWRDPENTAKAFDPDGWFHTGDIATVDPTGRVTIQARLSDRIALASGIKVFPPEIETVLLQQPEVRDCAVVGLASPDGAEQVHAAVVPAAGASEEAVAAAVRRANAMLSSHLHIAGLTVWPGDFPRTALGKIRRRDVAGILSGRIGSMPESGRAVTSPPQAVTGMAAILAHLGLDPSREPDPSREVMLDSLGRVELATLVEQALGLELDEDQLARADTVGQLLTLLQDGGSQSTRMTFPEWSVSSPVRAIRAALQEGGLFTLHRLIARPFRVEHAERLSSLEGPVLFIANHSSHVDTVSILRALPRHLRRRVAVAAAADYFFASGPRSLGSALVLNAFPFSRSGQVRASLRRCGELVDGGWSILIYPEGTRSTDGSLLPFKSGIGLLASGLSIPVVPLAVTGGLRILPKGSSWPRSGPVTVRVGRPLHIDPDADSAAIAAILQAEVAALMTACDAEARQARGGTSS